MSTDHYTPDEYANLIAEKATHLAIDISDGTLGRGRGARDSMIEQLTGAGLFPEQAAKIVEPYAAQLDRIDRAAEALLAEYHRLAGVTAEMTRATHWRIPGYRFDGYTV